MTKSWSTSWSETSWARFAPPRWIERIATEPWGPLPGSIRGYDRRSGAHRSGRQPYERNQHHHQPGRDAEEVQGRQQVGLVDDLPADGGDGLRQAEAGVLQLGNGD